MKKGIIIGGGIGGLTTAIALRKAGMDVLVCEQAPALREAGAGIWMAPNALQVLFELGIADTIIAAGKKLEKISVVDLKYRPISVIDGAWVRKNFYFDTVAIHRGVLQQLLAAQLPPDIILLNKRFAGFRQDDRSVVALFEDGTSLEADFLIGADGIHSVVRRQMQIEQQLRYSGQTCWRFIADFSLPEAEKDLMYEMWSDKKGLRVGYSHINDRQIYVYITDAAIPGGQDHPDTLRDDLLERCRAFPLLIRQMINAARPENIIRSDLYDFPPIPRWTEGRVALLGDAAHATTPNLGQGACQAMEDALILSRKIHFVADIPTALTEYQNTRWKKAAYITNTSYQFARVTNTTGLLRRIITGVLRATPARVNEQQFEKIYTLSN